MDNTITQSDNEKPLYPQGDEEVSVTQQDKPGFVTRWFSPIKAGSLRGGTISMVGSVFGTGCLTFPYAISKVGLIPGVILLLFVAISMSITLKMVLDSGLNMNVLNYNQLANKSMGRTWVMIYDIANIIIVIGTMMSFLITSYKLIIEFTIKVFGYDLNEHSYILYIVCCFFIQIPMCRLKDIAKLQYFLIAGSVSIMIVILLIGCEAPLFFIQNIKNGSKIALFKPLSLNYLETVAIFMFGYSNQNVLLQVMNELKTPSIKRGNKIIMRSFFLELFFYLIIGLGGYLSTFDSTPQIFITRPDLESFNPDYLIITSKIIIAICLHCIFPLKFNLFRESIKSMAQIEELTFKYDITMTIVTMIVLNVIVYFVDIITVIGFVGGIFTVMISFVIPQFDYIFSQGKTRMIITGYVLLAIFTVIGLGASIKSVVYYIMKIED